MYLVNKNNIFNDDYLNDIEMVEYENFNENTILIEKETFHNFELLKAHLKVDGIIIDIKDAYRSLERQENIFCEYANKYGLEKAEEMIIMPGFSEHHTGCAIDFVINVDEKWIDKNDFNKHKKILSKIYNDLSFFGFILRYPKGKENITLHPYSPNHITYVGEKLAKLCQDKVLEEILN